jgi:hypothetical protein
MFCNVLSCWWRWKIAGAFAFFAFAFALKKCKCACNVGWLLSAVVSLCGVPNHILKVKFVEQILQLLVMAQYEIM